MPQEPGAAAPTESALDRAPLVVVLSGPSGAGKDTLLTALLQRDSRCATVATAKTRPPRPGEAHGVHHLFLSDAEFDRMVAAGEFLEHATMYGHRSGVPRAEVRRLLAAGQTVLLRTDIQGARTLRQVIPAAVLIFVTAPDRATLERRLRLRATEEEMDLQRRLAAATAEMQEAAWFDSVVVNRDGEHAAAATEILGIIERERRRPDRPRPSV